jgi:hypothetical protein
MTFKVVPPLFFVGRNVRENPEQPLLTAGNGPTLMYHLSTMKPLLALLLGSFLIPPGLIARQDDPPKSQDEKKTKAKKTKSKKKMSTEKTSPGKPSPTPKPTIQD